MKYPNVSRLIPGTVYGCEIESGVGRPGYEDTNSLLSLSLSLSYTYSVECAAAIHSTYCHHSSVTSLCWRANTLATGSWDSTVKVQKQEISKSTLFSLTLEFVVKVEADFSTYITALRSLRIVISKLTDRQTDMHAHISRVYVLLCRSTWGSCTPDVCNVVSSFVSQGRESGTVE